ncbi:MAG: sterol desaturase family protein [Bryobacteraceae bacterium]
MPKRPEWSGPAIITASFALLVWLETRRELRPRTESKLRRNVRNFAVAALSGLTLRVLERPLLTPLTRAVERRSWKLPDALAIVLLDYTLYIWHVLTHKAPILWRLHKVHHTDLDLDASTGLRFHFAEMAASVPWRAAQVVVLGVTPRAYALWQNLLLVSIFFHHSNVRLPVRFERWLCRFVVTPRMHGIHHSIGAREVNSNWSSGLTVWDRLHGTLNLNVPQAAITIGAPGFRQPEDVTLARILAQPFRLD